ncbi:hypothetical protein THAOC_11710 [Thalassiosira oceanica]|uniref:Uncharacterized protein n=1 Tax=Thalassiosira oceanica TaxID=159749 RepID=K0T9T0_THAOC|nr:hypothetical protein THAOC_11710 [Thalassiosira oceanica]|eukprot:EJK67277.1 hypothetical protein THAOC_11710 [Thalassiosira oceanica]
MVGLKDASTCARCCVVRRLWLCCVEVKSVVLNAYPHSKPSSRQSYLRNCLLNLQVCGIEKWGADLGLSLLKLWHPSSLAIVPFGSLALNFEVIYLRLNSTRSSRKPCHAQRHGRTRLAPRSRGDGERYNGRTTIDNENQATKQRDT